MKKLLVKPKLNKYLLLVYREAKKVRLDCPNGISISGSSIDFRYNGKRPMQRINVVGKDGISYVYVKNYDRIAIIDIDCIREFKTNFKLEFQYYMKAFFPLKGGE